MLLVLLTSEDCSNSGSEGHVGNVKKDFYAELESEFKTETLAQEKLFAFEQRSLEMMEDLIDYLNISSDTTNPVEFRAHANNMIRETFYSKKDMELFHELIYKSGKRDKNSKVDNLSYLNLLLINKSIPEKIHESTWETYSGKIEFEIASSNLNNETIKGQLTILLKKVEKEFGEEKDLVWQLFFATNDP